MEVKVTEVLVATDHKKYPYTHRVEIPYDISIDVCGWLSENKIKHTRIGYNIFYLNKQNAGWLLMRWG